MHRPSVLFILSAQHCDPELQAEFGANIPACMVPIGPNRLIDLQLKEARRWIPNLKRTFVALPERRFSPGESDWPEDLQPVPMNSVSLEDTFMTLLNVFRLWSKEQEEGVFSEDEWDIHFINGDTLIIDREVWEHPCTAYVRSVGLPFEMSKEFRKELMHELPLQNTEYAGKGAFRFSHREMDDDPTFYNYGRIVRQGTPNQLLDHRWYDFGHAATYFQSKREWLSSRAFNQVKRDSYTGFIYKQGNNEKIKDEYTWYNTIPEQIKMYTPQVKVYQPEVGGFSYAMDYVPCPTLAELLVYGNHSERFWTHIAEKLNDLLGEMATCVPENVPNVQDGMFIEKTRSRINQLSAANRHHATEMINWLEPRVANCSERIGVLHGDLCFSNILYDRRTDMLKIIDPRGTGKNGVYGDQLYDISKLYHSTYGAYDFAVADMMPGESAAKNMGVLSDSLVRYIKQEFNLDQIDLMCATGLLFYSMLPLHADDMGRVKRLMKIATLLRIKWLDMKEKLDGKASN